MALAALLLAAPVSAAAGRAGTPDPSFGSNGRTLTGFPARAESGTIDHAVMLADGSVLTLGLSGRGYVISRLGPDGEPDPGFGDRGFLTVDFLPDGRRIFSARIGVQSNGRILLGVNTDFFKPGTLVGFEPDGALDLSFGEGGMADAPTGISLMAIDTQDRMIVAGGFGATTQISRFLADGRIDPAFGNDGTVDSAFSSTSGLSDISVAANRVTLGAPSGILRLQSDGSPDSGFGAGGIAPFSEGRAMVVQPDGRIVMTSGSSYVRRLLANGSPDPSFGEGGTTAVATGGLDSLALDGSGRILVGGTTFHFDPSDPNDFHVVRLDPSGLPDPTFGGDGVVTTAVQPGGEDTLNDLLVVAGGRILAAGTSRIWNQQKMALVRYTDDGSLDTGYGAANGIRLLQPMVPSNDRILDLAATDGGRIVATGAAGTLSAVAGYGPNGRLNPEFGDSGRIATRFTDAGSGDRAEAVLGLPGGSFVLCISSGTGSAVVRYSKRGIRDLDFGDGGVAPIPGIRRCGAIRSDREGGLIVAGVGAENYTHLTRLFDDGEMDPAYGKDGIARGPGFSPSGGGIRDIDLDLAPNGDAIIAGNRFGATLARFTGEGDRRQSFGRNGVLELDGIRSSLLRLGRAGDIEVTARGRIYVAGIVRQDLAVAALRADGRPVKSFGKGGLVTRKVLEKSAANDMVVQKNGAVVIAGSATGKCDGLLLVCESRVVVARFTPAGRPDRKFAKKGLLLRSFGVRSGATSIVSGKNGYTVGGFAETYRDRREFLLLRLNG